MDPEVAVNGASKRCKKTKKKAKKFYKTTAGIITAIRPCSIIVNIQEIIMRVPYADISLSEETFFNDKEVRTEVTFKFCGYNRACDLHPYFCRLSDNGNEHAKALLS